MYEMIKGNLLFYIILTAFVGLWSLLFICGIFKKTKNTESRKLKVFIRIGVSCALICFFGYVLVYADLFPISLAHYEYTHNFTEENIGVISNIEQKGNDRIYLIIDDTEYVMVDSRDSFVTIGKDIDKGDTVKFKYGTKSKFIFDIYQVNTSP